MITRWEAALLMALCLAFLAVNLTTATRYPTPWVDEVQFTDPAAHLALGRGFTSTVWIAQTSTEFWAGNAPLYSVLLSGWIRLFGLSPLAVRSFNYFLTVSLAILLWLWMVRGTVVRSPAWRLVVVALVFCGHGLMFSFRMGRYDVLGMLMSVLAALAWPSSLWPLFGAAVLMPLAGLQLIPGSLVFLFVLLLFQRRRAFRPAIVVISGVLCGVAILYVLYRANGVWEGFRASTRAVGVIGHSLPAKLAGLPHIYVADKSCFLLAAAAILLACVVGNKRALSGPLGFGLALMVVLPAALQVAGKFPIYYNWMVYLPLAIGVASAGAQEWKNLPRFAPGAVALLLVSAVLVGLPARVAVLTLNWAGRDPQAVDTFVQGHLRSSDVVLADFRSYYSAMKYTTAFYAPTYLGVMPVQQRQSLTALLLRREQFEAAENQLDGRWRDTGFVLARPSNRLAQVLKMREFDDDQYDLHLYRRDPQR